MLFKEVIEKCWDEKWREKRRKIEEAGDVKALRQLMFGRFICEWRLHSGRTQKRAAELAHLSRAEWNRIENGYFFPQMDNIPDIAYAINIDPAVLFRKAGSEVPEEFKHYDKKKAARDVIFALESSGSFVEFLLSMQQVWQEYQQDQLGEHQRIVIDLTYAQVIAVIEERFTVRQRLRLAEELVQRAIPDELKNADLNPQRFFEAIDAALDKLKKHGTSE